MASEEQKADVKMKLTVATVVGIVLLVTMATGPMAHKWLDYARKPENITKPWAPVWFNRVARLYEMTMRDEKAQDVYDEFYLYWGGSDYDDANQERFIDVREELNISDDIDVVTYFPWVNDKFDGYPGIDEDDEEIVKRRPKPLSSEPHKLFGKVLVARAKYFEGMKKGWRFRHIWACVRAQYEPGTWEGVEAEKAIRRDAGRSF